MVVKFFKIEVLYAKLAWTFLQWHRYSTKQNRRHENESRRKDRIESEQGSA